MELHVRGRTTHVLRCSGEETFSNIKGLIASLEGITIGEIQLYTGTTPIRKECTVADCEGADVVVTFPLEGGKVHGSLARAGKVRSQTPKVEKQEKKKKKTGRAKKRMQYNKRIVNAPVNGRRCGPNSNSL